MESNDLLAREGLEQLKSIEMTLRCLNGLSTLSASVSKTTRPVMEASDRTTVSIVSFHHNQEIVIYETPHVNDGIPERS